MAQVGQLTVDLVANTAEFSSNIDSATGKLKNLGDGAKAAGAAVDYSMEESRGAVILLGEQFGVHMPREITRMIATIPGVGLALESILPIMGVVFGVEMIYKWIEANKKAAEAAKAAWDGMDDASNTALHKMDEELLSSGAKIDDLNGKHLEALQKRLKLIDDQSLDKLADEFTKIAASADKVLGTLKAGWYQELQGKGDGVEAVKTHFDELQAKLQDMKSSGDVNGFSAALSQGIKETLARQDELNLHASSFHTEERSALAAELNALISQTQEMDKQNKISGNQKTIEKAEATKAAKEATRKLAEENQTLSESYLKARDAAVALGVEQRKMSGGGPRDASGSEADRQTAHELEEIARTHKLLEDETRSHAERMAHIQLDGETQSARHMLAMRQGSIAQSVRLEVTAAEKEHDIDVKADQARLRDLEQAAVKDSIAIKKAQDKLLEDEQKFQQKKTQIVQKGDEERARIDAQINTKMAQDASRAINAELFEHKHAAQAIANIGKQMLQTQIEQGMLALMHEETQAEREALIKAKSAAQSAFSSVMQHVPEPLSLVLAPAAAAAAFAGVMAFETGGEIPGSGPVPIIAHGGETVVTKNLTDQIKSGGSNSGGGKGGDSHVHLHASAMDAEGMDRVLQRHASKINQHVTASMRKQNR